MRLSAIHIYENFPPKNSQFLIGRLLKNVNFLLRHPVYIPSVLTYLKDEL